MREPDYGDHEEVRRVRQNGEIKWQGHTIYISEARIGEPVGLRDDGADGWAVCYGPIVLGTIAHNDDRLRKPKRKACGHVDDASKGIAHKPTGTAKADQNETRNVLPMSSV